MARESAREASADSSPRFLAALLTPQAYPHRSERVEMRQTHISWVFLVGDLVYKVKKPLHLAFLDYSTLERRRHFCHEEVRLNRRLAPDVYLGVVPILRRGSAFEVGVLGGEPTAGEVVEDYAVVMRRLPEERMLDRLLRRQGAGAMPVDAIAERLAGFHRGCPVGAAARWGSVEAIRELVLANLHETDPFVGDTLRRVDRELVEGAEARFIVTHRGLLVRRVERGFVREVHGDLRPEHICLTDDRIVVFDCVEFSERFRTCDVASEIAFLTMELDFLGFPELSEDLVRAYAAHSADDEIKSLLPFYGAYRAYVRGKVESLKSREREVPAPEREAARESADRYFRLASRYARGPRPAALVAVLGLSGTGKSTVARVASELTGFPVYSSDVVRKEIGRREGVTEPERLYAAELSRRTYQALRERAERRIAAGGGVIVDATFQDEVERLALAELAARRAVPLLLVECRAEEATVRRRLDERSARGDSVSDATWEVYCAQRDRFAPVTSPVGARHVVLDTTRGGFADALERALLD
jgi:aminoglycoside phosphotransferase family enzyme/predicted kinase